MPGPYPVVDLGTLLLAVTCLLVSASAAPLSAEDTQSATSLPFPPYACIQGARGCGLASKSERAMKQFNKLMKDLCERGAQNAQPRGYAQQVDLATEVRGSCMAAGLGACIGCGNCAKQ